MSGIATTLDTLGRIAHNTGNHQRAITYYQQTLTLHRELRNTYEVAAVVNRLGLSLLAIGQHHQARAAWEKAGELDYVKPDGRHHFSVAKPIVESMLGERDLTLLRGDIETVLYEAVRDHVEIRFGTTVDSVTQDDAGVHIVLSDGGTEDADLLVGADGVHSKVRELVFGQEHRFTSWRLIR